LLPARAVQYHLFVLNVITATELAVTDEYTTPLKSAAVDTLNV
jgi:hypothetical protein